MLQSIKLDIEINCACGRTLEAKVLRNDGYSDLRMEVESCPICEESAVDRGYESGYSNGYENGYSNGHENGYEQGRDDGHNGGYDEGYSEGYDKGIEEGQHQITTLDLSSRAERRIRI